MPFLKFVAAIIGVIFYGLPGALIGWFAGSLISTAIVDGPAALLPGGRQAANEARQKVFLKTLFLLMGKLAKTDAHVSQAEIDHVEKFMVQAGMSGEHRKEGIEFFQRGVKDSLDVDQVLIEFMQVCGRSLQMKHLLLVYLAGIALADGRMHTAENEMLASVAAKLGYSRQAFDQLMAMIQGQNRFAGGYERTYQQHDGQVPRGATNTLEEAYQALGVDADTSDRDVKRAYRKLISQYHPDKLIGQGVPEDMIAKATERSKEIHAAYDLIEKHRKTA